MTLRGPKLWLALCTLSVVIVVGVAALLVRHPGSAFDVLPGKPVAFPQLDRAALDPAQARVIDVLQAQYDAQPGGSHFSEGIEEPWCADFVSWVLNEAGRPLSNPNSGNWRIPGVYTLQEYYQAAGRFAAPDSYRPRPGDVVMYADGSPLGLHTNFVVVANDNAITTVGGNEEGGIRVHTLDDAEIAGILGYGRLAA
ncbi:CHAP domain-containing protein [Mycolicibacterium nivoides]|uniref:CHAP domain-containing protein n=1 Tax=Mycolicibacterium nivoides TaxID=2487344 RepID=A0ABW9L8U8_9MYCO|nr:CHAP domain-containing protein [Mycolicibacterium boenickei]SEP73490.1 CHAP domain-containing protein [Mycobacterium sp. 88mf]SFF13473.1 CHAP domain-containing protein [Mycobacterium sp. 455mf]